MGVRLFGCLGHGCQCPQQHRNRSDEVELRGSEGEERGSCEQGAGGLCGEVSRAHERSHDGAADEPDRDRQFGEQPAQEAEAQHGDGDGDEPEEQIPGIPEFLGVRLADDEFACHLNQIDADDDHHDADDQGREELQHLDEERHRENVEHAGQKHSPHSRLDVGALTDRDEENRGRAAGEHDEGQSHADLPDSHRLQDRTETGEHEDRRQNRRGDVRRQVERGGDEEDRGHRCGQHDEDMLDGERNESVHRPELIDRVNAVVRRRLFRWCGH